MTDIVERARADVLRSGTWADTGNLILEMADEIERLRAAIAAEREACAIIANHAGHKWAASARKEKTLSGQAVCESASSMAFELCAAIRNRSET